MRYVISSFGKLYFLVNYIIWILLLDTLAIIPFSRLRANQQPIKYAVLKILNVLTNITLNIFFLIYLPKIARAKLSLAARIKDLSISNGIIYFDFLNIGTSSKKVINYVNLIFFRVKVNCPMHYYFQQKLIIRN